MIDIVIPTMWMSDKFENSLELYVNHPHINKIIIVDNNKSKRPNFEVLSHKKIELVSYGRNIYVNPAWNEGYHRATSEILALINDDIIVYDSVFDMVYNFDFSEGDIIGVNLRGYQNNYEIDKHINTEEKIVKLNYDKSKAVGGQAWAFGICMFMLRKTYTPIPSLYQIWYGDDYLLQNCKNAYAINSNKIKGSISKTLVKYMDNNSDISKRVVLDSKNFVRFNHFQNGKNWDLPRKIAKESENILQVEYNRAKNTPSDINENVHILYDLAKECKTVVEMGVRTGVSTRAFLNTDVNLISFDVILNQNVQKLFDYAQQQGKNVQYIKADVLNIEIDDTDLLFIDTLHTYEQLKEELKLHGNKAQKYLAFHDTYTFGLRGENGRDKKGLMTAIVEFMIDNPHWKFKIHKTNNNGFTVLERT